MTAPDTTNTITVVPARMASTRLPGKPLADICGEPMIVHVWKRACEAAIGPVLVAAAEPEIVGPVERAGGRAVLTDPDLPSGSDRIAAALAMIDPQRTYTYVVNLQGDLPLMDPASIRKCLAPLCDETVDIATLAAAIDDPHEVTSPDVVKVIADLSGAEKYTMAKDFVRIPPPGARPPFWHHIGIYAYQRSALERFVALPVSQRERDRRLEQMRAMDNAMTIAVSRVDTIPFGVDTPADLERARAEIARMTG
jgi:3-deoxy-manno-octulosonate cytidylyltransferase (CMP-KDO synthetase)